MTDFDRNAGSVTHLDKPALSCNFSYRIRRCAFNRISTLSIGGATMLLACSPTFGRTNIAVPLPVTAHDIAGNLRRFSDYIKVAREIQDYLNDPEEISNAYGRKVARYLNEHHLIVVRVPEGGHFDSNLSFSALESGISPVFYSRETGLGGFAYLTHISDDQRPTIFRAQGFASAKGHRAASISLVGTNMDSLAGATLGASVAAYRYPQSFFVNAGNGQETFTPEDASAHVDVAEKFFGDMVSVTAFGDHHRTNIKSDPTATTLAAFIQGKTDYSLEAGGGTIDFVGPLIFLSATRFPADKNRLEFQLQSSREVGVSNPYDFVTRRGTWNSETAIWRGLFLGTHYSWEQVKGRVPFDKLLVLGGPDHLRGYSYSRFRGNTSHYARGTFGYHVGQAMGIEGNVESMIEAGRMESRTPGLDPVSWKTSYGGGLEFVSPVGAVSVSHYWSREGEVTNLLVRHRL